MKQNDSTTFIISHYKDNYDWVKEYTDSFIVYHKDRKNVGYNIYTIMSFIVDNYENLPNTCIFIKDNILERHITRGEFEVALLKSGFTPLLTQNHKTDGVINFYKDGLYYEKNNYWYLHHYGHRDGVENLIDLLGIRDKDYLGFAPGANYIVPKENILKHTKDFYQTLLDAVSYTQLPGEAHLIERSLYHIWSTT